MKESMYYVWLGKHRINTIPLTMEASRELRRDFAEKHGYEAIELDIAPVGSRRIDTLDSNQLWELRKEIVLNSLYISDYENSFHIDPNAVCDFFDGYLEFLSDIAIGLHLDCDDLDEIFSLDCKEYLWDYDTQR